MSEARAYTKRRPVRGGIESNYSNRLLLIDITVNLSGHQAAFVDGTHNQ